MSTAGGLLFVDKPAGLTSHDVVARVRKAARTRRVGHAGTLDPFATGLLVLAVGTSTRLLQFVDGEPKIYLAEIRFGVEMDTDDATGRVVREAALPDPDAIDRAIDELSGSLSQVPPAFSAKHVEGTRAYEIARRGDHVELAASNITVHRWSVEERSYDRIRARITCTGGTYVRAIARDLGRLTNSAAHCSALRRLSSGPVSVDGATTLDVLIPGAITDGTVPLVNPLSALGDLVRHVISADDRHRLSNGRAIIAAAGIAAEIAAATAAGTTSPSRAVFLDEAGIVLGIGELMADEAGVYRWQPRVLLDTQSLASAT